MFSVLRLAILGTVLGTLCSTCLGNLVSNGSFESGVNPGSFEELPVGSTAISDWVVIGGAIDYVGSEWFDIPDGTRALDLHGSSGPSAGGVAQAFLTTPGTQYLVAFDLASGPSSAFEELRIQAALDSQDFETGISGNNPYFIGWERKEWAFTAIASLTTLEFLSIGSPDTIGPALDNVVVTAVPEPTLVAGWLLISVGYLIRRNSSLSPA